MSNFYLCDYCKHQHDRGADYARADNLCDAGEVEPKVMVDHHGVGGKRYDDPTDVCKHFKAKEDR